MHILNNYRYKIQKMNTEHKKLKLTFSSNLLLIAFVVGRRQMKYTVCLLTYTTDNILSCLLFSINIIKRKKVYNKQNYLTPDLLYEARLWEELF